MSRSSLAGLLGWLRRPLRCSRAVPHHSQARSPRRARRRLLPIPAGHLEQRRERATTRQPLATGWEPTTLHAVSRPLGCATPREPTQPMSSDDRRVAHLNLQCPRQSKSSHTVERSASRRTSSNCASRNASPSVRASASGMAACSRRWRSTRSSSICIRTSSATRESTWEQPAPLRVDGLAGNVRVRDVAVRVRMLPLATFRQLHSLQDGGNGVPSSRRKPKSSSSP
jgi:hypothetical protein